MDMFRAALMVSVIGIVLATALGALIGILRITNNPLVKAICASYVEFIRNVPLLVQLFF